MKLRLISRELAVDTRLPQVCIRSFNIKRSGEIFKIYGDFFYIDARRLKRQKRKHRRRLLAIKIACSYIVTEEDVADNLYQ